MIIIIITNKVIIIKLELKCFFCQQMEFERDGHAEPPSQHSTEPVAPRVAHVCGTQEEAAGYTGPSPGGNTTSNTN